MTCSDAGVRLIQSFEGLRLAAYLDSAGIPTIGYGTIRYPNGIKVTLGDVCTEADADDYFRHDLTRFDLDVDALTTDAVAQREFDALCSFCYNVGSAAYKGSRLRQKVNADHTDGSIREEFMKWHYAGGKPVLGLWNRRHKEADFYFGVTTPIPPMPR